MTATEVVVLRFVGRRVPRPLAGLRVLDAPAGLAPPTALADVRRIIVLGTPADLATVLSRLLRTDRLDVEVALVQRSWTARRARTAPARRVPLIRDETGTVLARTASWLPPDETTRAITGEAVVDDTVLFDGAAAEIRIEPTAGPPGLRARVVTGPLRPPHWVTGRAAQLGTINALVVRDGVPAARPVRRSTFYRHTTGWLRVF